ncbi:uncharacterized protein LOC144612937 isoform X2 [Panthera onca]
MTGSPASSQQVGASPEENLLSTAGKGARTHIYNPSPVKETSMVRCRPKATSQPHRGLTPLHLEDLRPRDCSLPAVQHSDFGLIQGKE